MAAQCKLHNQNQTFYNGLEYCEHLRRSGTARMFQKFLETFCFRLHKIAFFSDDGNSFNSIVLEIYLVLFDPDVEESDAMKIIVKYFAMVRDATGHRDDILDFYKETSAKRMLSILCDMYGADFKRVVCSEDGSLRKGLIFLLNGEAVDNDDLKSKILMDEDVVAIMPPVGGG
jgi:MoaD family protein